MAAAEGLVSIHFVNAAGSVLVAPYGGVERRLSTAPYCVGLSRKGQGPIVLDFAPPVVAEAKVLVARRGGKKLPKGAPIDLDGNLSEDPAVLYGPHTAEGPRDYSQRKGAIRAFGEHKGSGLAFICELLGGALTGTGATGPDRRFANGMFAVYVDPKVVDTGNFFDGEISRYVDFIRATKPVAGVDAVLIPGDPERKMRADRTKKWRALAGRHLGSDSEYRARSRRERGEHPTGCELTARAIQRNRLTATNDKKGNATNGKQRQESMGLGQGRGERLACDSVRVFRRSDRAMRVRQRHRRHAAWRAGLPIDGAMFPGDAGASGDADGPRALERAGHDRQGAGWWCLWRD